MPEQETLVVKITQALKAIRDGDVRRFNEVLERLPNHIIGLSTPSLWTWCCAQSDLSEQQAEMLVLFADRVFDAEERWFFLALAALASERWKERLLSLSTPETMRRVYYTDAVDKLALRYNEMGDFRMQYARLHPQRTYVAALTRYRVGEVLALCDDLYFVYAPLAEVEPQGQVVWDGEVCGIRVVAGIPLNKDGSPVKKKTDNQDFSLLYSQHPVL